MIKVQLKNVIYQIDESKLKQFQELGYRQLDEQGKMMPTEADLKKSYDADRIAALEKELAEVQAPALSETDEIILTKFKELLKMDKITKTATHAVAEEIVATVGSLEDDED